MLKYKTIVAAVLATAAFAVYAEPPENWDVESGPQPAPYGVVDPVLTPADLKVAGFQYVGDVESGPQPAPYGVVDPVLTPDDLKVAGFQYDEDVESGPQPAPYGVADPVLTPADLKFAVSPQNVESGSKRVN